MINETRNRALFPAITTSLPTECSSSEEERCNSVFRQTQTVSSDRANDMKEYCYRLIEGGEYNQVVPIASNITCVLRQHCVISRLIQAGAYQEATEIASNMSSSLEKVAICAELLHKQQYEFARSVAGAIENRLFKEEQQLLIDIEEGVPLEILKENISKCISNSTKHSLSIALLKKSTPETVSDALDAIKNIFKTCRPPIPDDVKCKISMILLERNAPELANKVAQYIKDTHHRTKILLLTLIAVGDSILRFPQEIGQLNNNSLNEICLALINQKKYKDSVAIAMQFKVETNGRHTINPEWRKCEIFLRLLECDEKEADGFAVELVPFIEVENLILVHEAIMKKTTSTLNPQPDLIKRLQNQAQRLQNLGYASQAVCLKRLTDRVSIDLLRDRNHRLDR